MLIRASENYAIVKLAAVSWHQLYGGRQVAVTRHAQYFGSLARGTPRYVAPRDQRGAGTKECRCAGRSAEMCGTYGLYPVEFRGLVGLRRIPAESEWDSSNLTFVR